jgi:hypothetical protein
MCLLQVFILHYEMLISIGKLILSAFYKLLINWRHLGAPTLSTPQKALVALLITAFPLPPVASNLSAGIAFQFCLLWTVRTGEWGTQTLGFDSFTQHHAQIQYQLSCKVDIIRKDATMYWSMLLLRHLICSQFGTIKNKIATNTLMHLCVCVW